MNTELGGVNSWIRANKLTLNVSKSNYIIFHRNSKKFVVADYITIDDHRITRVHSTRFLGVIVDDCLNWRLHVQHVLRKISKFNPIFRHIRSLVSQDVLKLLYNSLVYPHLTYCNSVWGACVRATLHPLMIVQKKIVRTICFSNFREHSAPLFKSLQFLTLTDINKYMIGIMVYKSLFGLNCVDDWFSVYVNVYNTRLAVRGVLDVPPVRTNHSRQSVCYRGPIIWNTIPESIQTLETCNSFKFKFKRHLLNMY